MPKIFVSYSAHEAPTARRIADRIAALGGTPWFAERDLVPGAEIMPEIDQAIRESDAAIVVASPEPGGWVKYEMGRLMEEVAHRPEFRVVPVTRGGRWDSGDGGLLPKEFERFQALSSEEPDLQMGLRRLLVDLGVAARGAGSAEVHRVERLQRALSELYIATPSTVRIAWLGSVTAIFFLVAAIGAHGLVTVSAPPNISTVILATGVLAASTASYRLVLLQERRAQALAVAREMQELLDRLQRAEESASVRAPGNQDAELPSMGPA